MAMMLPLQQTLQSINTKLHQNDTEFRNRIALSTAMAALQRSSVVAKLHWSEGGRVQQRGNILSSCAVAVRNEAEGRAGSLGQEIRTESAKRSTEVLAGRNRLFLLLWIDRTLITALHCFLRCQQKRLQLSSRAIIRGQDIFKSLSCFQFEEQLNALKRAGVHGVMVDCWWGLVEAKGPKLYDWSGHRILFDVIREGKLKLQVKLGLNSRMFISITKL